MEVQPAGGSNPVKRRQQNQSEEEDAAVHSGACSVFSASSSLLSFLLSSAAVMSTDSSAPLTAENGNGGNKRMFCPLYSCKRSYTDRSALEAHIKDHEIPAQSLPGKILLCPSIGCNSSFPNMQKLMEHTRHHHKPNIFFLCESCRTKLRSYRGLLTHLHTCSKVPRGKPKSAEPVAPQPAAVAPQPAAVAPQPAAVALQPPTVASPILTPPEQIPPQLDLSTHQAPFPIPTPPAAPQPDATLPVHSPQFLPTVETTPPQLAPQLFTEAAPQLQPQPMNEPSSLPQCLSFADPAVSPDAPDGHGQHQTQVRSPGSAPQSPVGSTAVWKKSPGLACSRRILWEHTKGRYTCVQCGHSVTNRKEITQHISTHHSNSSKPSEDTGSSTAST